MEIDTPCGVAPPLSSCMPLSQYKSQVLWCRERLRVIVFDKTAILSFLVCQNRIQLLPYFDRRPSDSLHRKKTDCLSLLRLLPPWFNPLLVIEYISLTFPM